MPFGNKARQVRAYEFGCLPPTNGESEAVEAMNGRVRLWNKLVELDRRYETERDAALAPHLDGAEKIEWRRRPPMTDEERGAYKHYRAARKAAFALPEVLEKINVLEKQELTEAREVCHDSELIWYNYEEVLLTWQQARRRPGDLQFHSIFREAGKITVRWQTGLPVAKAFQSDGRLQLHPVPAEAYTSPVRAERRKLSRSIVHLRVRSEGRAPVWVELPCILHRSLPADGLLRQASILRERVGLRYRWKMIIVVETPEIERATGSNVSVHVDVGWSKVPEGLRVASWLDSNGRTGQLALSEHWLNAMQKVEDLRSIRDNHFNEARKLLAEYVHAGEGPTWLRDATMTIPHWHAPQRLAAVVARWRDNRFDGDEMLYTSLEQWRARERHLHEYESNLRDQALRERREMYRVFAVGLARRYCAVTLKEIDLSRIAMRRSEALDLHAPVRHLRFLASISSLRNIITQTCEREGVTVSVVSQKGASSEQETGLREAGLMHSPPQVIPAVAR